MENLTGKALFSCSYKASKKNQKIPRNAIFYNVNNTFISKKIMKMKKPILLLLLLSIVMACNDDDDTFELSATNLVTSLEENPAKDQSIGFAKTNSNSSSLQYRLVSQNIDGALKINAKTGEITVLNPDLFDFEKNPVIMAVYEATLGKQTDQASVEINLENVYDHWLEDKGLNKIVTTNYNFSENIESSEEAIISEGRLNKVTYKDASGSVTGYDELSYDSTGKLILSSHIEDNTTKYFTAITYDSNDRITKIEHDYEGTTNDFVAEYQHLSSSEILMKMVRGTGFSFEQKVIIDNGLAVKEQGMNGDVYVEIKYHGNQITEVIDVAGPVTYTYKENGLNPYTFYATMFGPELYNGALFKESIANSSRSYTQGLITKIDYDGYNHFKIVYEMQANGLPTRMTEYFVDNNVEKLHKDVRFEYAE